MCAHFTPCITCKDLAMFAGFSVHDAVAAYYNSPIKDEAYVSPRGTDVLPIASNLYLHAVLIYAFFIPSPGLY